jgi:hypothetical protein
LKRKIKDTLVIVLGIICVIIIWVPLFILSDKETNNVSVAPEKPLVDIIELQNNTVVESVSVDYSLDCSEPSINSNIYNHSEIFKIDYDFLLAVHRLHNLESVSSFILDSGLRTEKDLIDILKNNKVPPLRETYLQAYKNVFPNSKLTLLYNKYKEISGKDISNLK